MVSATVAVSAGVNNKNTMPNENTGEQSEVAAVVETPKAPKPTAANIEETTIERTIGIEIESFMQDPDMGPLQETGVDISGDGSISGDGQGVEIQTPPVRGAKAEKMIRAACDALNEQNAQQNSSCGVHVHVDAKELTARGFIRSYNSSSTPIAENETMVYLHRAIFQSGRGIEAHMEVLEAVEVGELHIAHGQYGVGNIVRMYGEHRFKTSAVDGGYIIPAGEYGNYLTFAVDIDAARELRERLFNAMRFFSAIDPVLRSLVPSSRRHNRYCQPFEKMVRSGGAMPRTFREQLNGITDRYCGINMQALGKHGTIENRYHGGTLNADKIIHWARLWERCVNVALSDNATVEADALAEVPNSKSRLDMLLALTELPDATCNYLRERYAAFLGSDARHAIAYINGKAKKRAARQG